MAGCTKEQTARASQGRRSWAEVDNSLRRLGMDYVDIYQIHRFDPSTPVEETLEVLNEHREGRKGPICRGIVDVWVAVR